MHGRDVPYQVGQITPPSRTDLVSRDLWSSETPPPVYSMSECEVTAVEGAARVTWAG